jgi:hypothetical protein
VIDPIVTVAHIKKARLCTRGARTWANRHGFDYMKFLHEGCPASVIEATGDSLGRRVAAIARREAEEKAWAR